MPAEQALCSMHEETQTVHGWRVIALGCAALLGWLCDDHGKSVAILGLLRQATVLEQTC